MAKKPKQEQEIIEPPDDVVDVGAVMARIVKDLDKEYGAGVFVPGSDALSATPQIVPTSPAIDSITGGIEEGSWVGITGNPKTGKTTLALCIAAACQQPENGNRVVIYAKVEGRLARNVLSGIKGLDLSKDKFRIIQSRPGHILPAHEHLRIVARCVKDIPGCCVILDSASALCDQGELNAEIGESGGIAGGARLFSQFVRQMSQVVPVNRTIMLVISHLISDIKTQRLSERSARAVQYQYDYMLRTIGKEAWKAGEEQIGLKINWACNTSKLMIPGMTAVSHIRFGTGIDKLYEAIVLGMDAGLVELSGSWFVLKFVDEKKPPKYQGGEKVYQALLENPEWVKLLEDKLRGIVGTPTSGDSE